MSALRNFFLLVTLVADPATSALAQNVAPAAAPVRSDTQSTVSIPGGSVADATMPDVSGTWVYPFCCGFAPQLSGPGPIVNKNRRAQTYGADGLPLPVSAAPRASDLSQYVGDYTNPILKPQAADVVKQHGEIELSGLPNPTPRSQCWPEGVPFIFANMGMQILQKPDRITILYEHDHQVRTVRMNQPHPAQVTPSWYGDSVGRYDGDTLVVDTTGIKAGPYSMIDWFGTPYTHALHVVERYRLVDYETMKEADERIAQVNRRMASHASGATGLPSVANYKGKGLQLEFTVEDGGVFTTPWSATISYWHSTGEWPEHVCAENLRGTYVVRDSAAPRADKADF